jgi:hypothetical protein
MFYYPHGSIAPATTPTSSGGGLAVPNAIAQAPSAPLYILNSGTSAAVYFQDGLYAGGPNESVDPGTNQIAIAGDGTIVFSSASHSRLEFVGSTPAQYLTGFSGPHGVAFDVSGNLYIADYSAGKVYTMAPPYTTGTQTPIGGTFNGPTYLAVWPTPY